MSDLDEGERWRIAFERCDESRCCTGSRYHRPGCQRRADTLKRRRIAVEESVQHTPPAAQPEPQRSFPLGQVLLIAVSSGLSAAMLTALLVSQALR